MADETPLPCSSPPSFKPPVINYLTFFYAICVLHLFTLLHLPSLSSSHDNNRLSLRGVFGTIFYFLGLFLFFAFNLYVWITAPCFESQTERNASTIYVSFDTDINPTNNVIRWIFVAATCVALVIIIIYAFIIGSTLKALL